MKNLKLLKSRSICVDQLKGANSVLIINNGELCYSTDQAVWRINVGDQPHLVIDLKTTETYKAQDVKIVCYIYNPPWDSFLVSCSNGDVILIQENIVEIAYNCEQPANHLMCSPDYERFVLISENGQVTVVTECFDVLNNFNVKEILLTEQQLVNVGWGKKETQFHGSEGKNKRIVKEIVGDGIDADNAINICWRPDSMFFAVGYFNTTNNLRTIKIFNRDGILQYISEPLPGIKAVLSWKTSKDLMSFPQQTDEKYLISFMEKNGLKHGEFVIPSELEVNQILWNHDSSIMCLHCEYSGKIDCLLMLTCTNYQWQIKKWMTFKHKIIAAKWLPTNNLQLITVNGVTTMLHWIETLSTSSSGTLDWVAVIDHCSILLTPFKEVIIPPPMYHLKLTLDKPIDSVLFLPHNLRKNGNNICVVCNDRSIHFYEYKKEFMKKISVNNITDTVGLIDHWFWYDENTLLFSLSELSDIHHICILVFDADNKNITKHTVCQPVIGVTNHTRGALVQLSDGDVLLWNAMTNKIEPYASLPEECTCIRVMEDKIYALGVSKRLFENDKVILNNIESFCLRYPFVLAVTLNQRLIAYNINPSKDDNDEYQRRVETGSTIIIVTGNSVILQLPRGNLETIRPRPLTILSAINFIVERKYLMAFELLRKERINLNVLCDLDPAKFIKDLSEFINQVKDSSWISLFITELENKNYLNTVYASQFQENKVKELDNKVHMVCSRLIDILNEKDKEKYAFPLLGCYVKLKKFDLALNLASLNNVYLKHLLFLVDVDKLYKASLAEYNLEMAMQIINNSQLDPKEYVPFLRELEKMNNHFMRFTIEDKLGNKIKALNNLVQCEDNYKQCLAYIIDNNLYTHALTLYNQNQDEYKLIATHYGDLLYSKMDYKQAALVYSYSTERKKAISSYLKAGFWKEALELCYKLNYDDTGKSEVKKTIISMLSSTQRYREAADFAELELKDTKLAVDYCIKAQDYVHALYLAQSRLILDTNLENQIKSACVTTALNLINDIILQHENFNTHIKRLVEVRKEKSIEPSDYDNLNDTNSEISSVSSYRTSSTRTSCRSAKKQQRKMWNLKIGNFREEPTLVLTLKQIIEKTEKYKDEVKNVCFLLLKLNEYSISHSLQITLDSFLTCVLDKKSIIWPIFNETEQVYEDAILLCPLKIVADKNWKLSVLE
ncbi:elongator complex protein 1 [Adelges cooleyi]|uniref:elongator complex protein 1 n=1 Tax=Adelges cooleyi TaxID=133065 RepID=UPI00217FD128|nr:elongator complex protein 1 [Adelges cooleyi]